MPYIKCSSCGNPNYYSPSHAPKRGFCSTDCYAAVRDQEIKERGERTRYEKGHVNSENQRRVTSERMKDEKHHNWKGEDVGYRGLHYWIGRKLGKPTKCSNCGVDKTTPKSIQWANIDRKYRRDVSDYIAMCSSCHKIHDLALIRASRGD